MTTGLLDDRVRAACNWTRHSHHYSAQCVHCVYVYTDKQTIRQMCGRREHIFQTNGTSTSARERRSGNTDDDDLDAAGAPYCALPSSTSVHDDCSVPSPARGRVLTDVESRRVCMEGAPLCGDCPPRVCH